MKSLFVTGAIAAAMGLLAAGTTPAQADSITWQVRSFYPSQVNVKFFSSNRKAIWPGATQSYILKDFKVATFKLSCVAGERICYGAAAASGATKHWGVGPGGKAGCKDCCQTCGGDTKTKIHDLNDR